MENTGQKNYNQNKQNNTSDTEDTNWRERQNTNWRTQDKKITIGINKITPVIQKIPIRGKDKIPIGEHRTKKLQSE